MDRGQEIRELKLGASFTHPNARTGYHTIKYDFKPASVDAHKEATLETGSNNQVTVTVPHLDGSGVPNTIFKGNQRDYTKKECVLIFNRETNEIILEKLCGNITVKKTRADTSNKLAPQQPPPPPIGSSTTTAAATAPINNLGNPAKVENQTARHSTKTRVSTGIRKNVLNFVPKHSPLQGSPSYPHKSPQQQASWNANNSNNTSTLPSIPSLLDDNFASNQQQPQSSVMYNKNSNNNSSTSSQSLLSSSSSSSSSMLMPKASSAISNQQQQQQQQPLQHQQQQQQSHQMAIDDIGVLSTSESSSDSNDSDSDSDSGDSIDHPTTTAMSSSNININNNMNMNNISMAVNHNISNNNNNNNNNHNINNNGNHKKGNHLDNSTALLQKDLCLSHSNSDSDF